MYGDNHHFTVCAKQNLDYVINKKKSLDAFVEGEKFKMEKCNDKKYNEKLLEDFNKLTQKRLLYSGLPYHIMDKNL